MEWRNKLMETLYDSASIGLFLVILAISAAVGISVFGIVLYVTFVLSGIVV